MIGVAITTITFYLLAIALQGATWQVALTVSVIVVVLRYTYLPSILAVLLLGRMCIAGPLADKDEPELAPAG